MRYRLLGIAFGLLLCALVPSSAEAQQCCASFFCTQCISRNCVSCNFVWDEQTQAYQSYCDTVYGQASCGCSYQGPIEQGCAYSVGNCSWVTNCNDCYTFYCNQGFAADTFSAAVMNVACRTWPWEPRQAPVRHNRGFIRLARETTLLSGS
jgi:hypothetical protein